MARELSEEDLRIFFKLAPECEGMKCDGSGDFYRSILPPVANHYSADAADFSARLESLDDEDLRYIVDLVMDSSESLCCIEPGFLDAFLDVVERRFGADLKKRILLVFAFG